MKKGWLSGFVAVALFLVLAGCGKKEASVTTAVAESVPNVTIVKVTRSSIADSYDATGTVAAKTTTQISGRTLGRVNSLRVNEGDSVSRGQLLVEIDDRDVRTQLEKAQAGLKEAQASRVELDNSTAAANAAVRTAEANKQLADATFARYSELYKRKSVSGQEYDEAEAKRNAAASELDRAKANVQTIVSKRSQIAARIEQANADIANSKIALSYSRIVSPVSGIVVKKFVEAGATASPGAPLLSIEDNSQYRLEAAVEESRSKFVQVGSRVAVTIDAIGGGELFGTVAEILPSADAASRSFTVKIDLPPNAAMRSGQYGVAHFSAAQKEAITVPDSSIVSRGQLNGVYVLTTDGIAQFRIVTLGKRAEGAAEILSGLSEGDEIAASDVDRIRDGSKLR